MSNQSAPILDVPSSAGPDADAIETGYNWPPQRSIRTAAMLIVIGSGVSAITLGLLAVRPGTYAFIVAGVQFLLALVLLLLGERVAILTLSSIAAIALWPAVRSAFGLASGGLETPAGISVVIYGMQFLVAFLLAFWYILPFTLLLIGKQGRTKHAFALAIFVLYELVATVSMVVAAMIKRGWLPH